VLPSITHAIPPIVPLPTTCHHCTITASLDGKEITQRVYQPANWIDAVSLCDLRAQMEGAGRSCAVPAIHPRYVYHRRLLSLCALGARASYRPACTLPLPMPFEEAELLGLLRPLPSAANITGGDHAGGAMDTEPFEEAELLGLPASPVASPPRRLPRVLTAVADRHP
jgi:hypothetical protein